MNLLRTCVQCLQVLALAAMSLAIVPGSGAAAAALRVPVDYPTIQTAVDAAAPGDTVLVSPGTYVELVNFQGKGITVESTDGAAATIIDGNHSSAGAVVNMTTGPDETPVLRGFTIRNGVGRFGASGIATQNGPALIEDNRLTGNSTCNGVIEASFSSATIRNNLITGNQPNGCSSGLGGGGILVGGAGTVIIADNVITGNVTSTDGGGISLWAAGSPTVSGNVITNNAAPDGFGGGISHFNMSDSLIVNNLIAGNTGRTGGGVYWLTPSGTVGPTLLNNTIADNIGAAVYADGFDANARLVNNIVVGSGTHAAIECGDFNDANPPIIRHNDVFSAGTGPTYAGLCTDQTGLNGNISADPLFIDAAGGDYHLSGGSPAVDAGLNADAPTVDLDGDARPFDGDGDGLAVVDLGADEFTGQDTTPPTISCGATPSSLSPANRQLRSVAVSVTTNDDSDEVTVTLLSVTSSQPDSGLGGGDVPGDIQEWATGTDDRTGLLRAERFRTARLYTLTYEAADPSGNTATCQATVTVPLR